MYLCSHNTDYYISVASKKTSATLWNHRIYHMSEKEMHILHSRKLIPDLKQVSSELCENCIYGKQKRVKFIRVGSKQRRSENLELVLTNVCRLAHAQTLGVSHYYVTFIDDATRKLGFIASDKNLMCLQLLRSGKVWLRMRHGKY